MACLTNTNKIIMMYVCEIVVLMVFNSSLCKLSKNVE